MALDEKSWLISLISGIIALVSLFIPAGMCSYQVGWGEYVNDTLMFWGAVISTSNPSGFPATFISPLYLVTLLIVLISAIGLILIGILNKLEILEFKQIWWSYLIIGGLLIFASIFFISNVLSFWLMLNPNFATPGPAIAFPFIAGGLSILIGVYGLIDMIKS